MPADPPPAPPLPPQRQQARNAFTRFVQQSFTSYSRPPSQAQARPDSARPPLQPRIPGLSSLSSQDASHKTGLDISAVHINQERTHAVLAGREILKTVRITGTKCAEETNLRAAIINYASHHQAGAPSAPTRHRDTLEIHDVKWSHGSYSTHIATAAANGKVVLYDLNRTGVELAQLHEHHRQVHKLAFNPHQGYLLLSGSRDATARLWDLRDMKKDVMSCPSRDRYSGQSEGIRDIKWSPTDGVEFAFGTENGVIQRWDYRMNRAPKLKINAHDKTCYAIDWHPDGKHLASASADRSVRIWDFSSDQRRQKPAWIIRTPYPVFNAQWRPPFWSPDQEHGVWQCTQLVTAYDRDHPVVHVWDFRRPSLPFREIPLYQTAPTDLLWRSRDLLWTVGREGIFTQSDVHFAPKVVDRRNMSSFAVSSSGDISAFSQKRARRRASGGYESDETYTTDGRTKRELSEKSSLPRSSADDSIDDSFLSSSYKRHHGRTSSSRSTKSISSTPPSSDNPGKMLFLNESLANQKHSFTPNQVAVRGAVPGSINVPLFTFLAQKYNMIAIEDPPTIQSFQNLQRVFDANAEYAQKAGNHRLANSWRVVGQTVSDAVQQRAAANHRRRLDQQPTTPAKPLPSAVSKTLLTEKKEQDLLAIPATRAIYGPDGQAQASADSSSQVPTPIARAINPAKASTHVEHNPLPDPEHDEALALPPSLVERSIPRGQGRPEPSSRRQARRSSIAHPSWAASPNDLEERRAMASSYRVPPRVPLSLEPYGSSPALNGRPDFDRHNSGESFAMFSASTDSHGLSVPGSFASGRSPSHGQDAESLQDRWDHQSSGPAFSSFGNGATSTSGPDPYMESPGGLRADVHKGPPPRINFDDSVPDHGNISSSASEQGRIAHEAIASSVANTKPATNVISSSSEQSRAIHDIETLRKHNQLMRNSSSESDAFTSTHGSFSEASVSNFDIMEASGTIVPDGPADAPSPNIARPPSLVHESVSAPAAIETTDAGNDSVILSDYLSKHASVDSELSAPFTLDKKPPA
ncbi:SEA (Seh1-associated) complex subunit [Diplodia seriata]